MFPKITLVNNERVAFMSKIKLAALYATIFYKIDFILAYLMSEKRVYFLIQNSGAYSREWIKYPAQDAAFLLMSKIGSPDVDSQRVSPLYTKW